MSRTLHHSIINTMTLNLFKKEIPPPPKKQSLLLIQINIEISTKINFLFMDFKSEDGGVVVPVLSISDTSADLTSPGICSTTQRALSSISEFNLILRRSRIMYWLLYVPEINKQTGQLLIIRNHVFMKKNIYH